MSRDCCVALPCGAMGLSAVCDCGISWSYVYLLTISYILNHPGLEVIKLEYSLRLKIKRNDWLLAEGYVALSNLSKISVDHYARFTLMTTLTISAGCKGQTLKSCM